MPPKGGFPHVNVVRNLPKKGLSGPGIFLSVAGIMTYGFYAFSTRVHEWNDDKVDRAQKIAANILVSTRMYGFKRSYVDGEPIVDHTLPSWQRMRYIPEPTKTAKYVRLTEDVSK